MNDKEKPVSPYNMVGASIIGFTTNDRGDVTSYIVVHKNGARYKIVPGNLGECVFAMREQDV